MAAGPSCVPARHSYAVCSQACLAIDRILRPSVAERSDALALPKLLAPQRFTAGWHEAARFQETNTLLECTIGTGRRTFESDVERQPRR